MGSPWGTPDAQTVNLYADRYDSIQTLQPLSNSIIAQLKARNPNIWLLQMYLPAGDLNRARWPESFYLRDRTSGLKTRTDSGWWTIDITLASVRRALIDYIVNRFTPAGMDGFYLNLAYPFYLNVATRPFVDEDGKCADFQELDGAWDCSQPRPSAMNAVKATYADFMLKFQQEMKAVTRRPIMWDNMPNTLATYNAWKAHIDGYIAATDGTIWEGKLGSVDASGEVVFHSETDWKYVIDTSKEQVESGKYVYFVPNGTWKVAMKVYGFASYLLFADGRRAIYHVDQIGGRFGNYDPALYDVNYGVPDTRANDGAYQTLRASPSGSIYKRTFTQATVWVNPGTITRSADGKTLAPHTAIIDLKSYDRAR